MAKKAISLGRAIQVVQPPKVAPTASAPHPIRNLKHFAHPPRVKGK